MRRREPFDGRAQAVHFADRLLERARDLHTAVCVGIDPRYELLPAELRRRAREVAGDPAEAAAWAYTELARRVVDATAPYACAAKPQVAFYEALGPAGARSLVETVHIAAEAGLVVIADAKRGDIGSTCEAYAQGLFGGQVVDGDVLPGTAADAITVNPYFGTDGVEPFLRHCDTRQRGVFVLVRTSNPSAAELQDLPVATPSGATSSVWLHVAQLVAQWGDSRIGTQGYSSVGAVGGATDPQTLAQLREAVPTAILLVPGYGAQGATAADVACAFDASGYGAVVNASRSIVFADRSAETAKALGTAAADAAQRMRDEIGEAVARRRG